MVNDVGVDIADLVRDELPLEVDAIGDAILDDIVIGRSVVQPSGGANAIPWEVIQHVIEVVGFIKLVIETYSLLREKFGRPPTSPELGAKSVADMGDLNAEQLQLLRKIHARLTGPTDP